MSDLKYLLKTNRELLRVLDEQLAELERVAPEFDETFSEKQAFFYLSTFTRGDTEARIQMDQDAAFVAEKLFIIQDASPRLDSPGSFSPLPYPPLPASRTFSFVDDYSGREMTLSTVGKQPVSSGAVPVTAIPFVATNVAISPGLPGSFTPHTGQNEWWFQLPNEFILPRGSVIRVRSTTLEGQVPPALFGFSVALAGYKVFG